MIVFDLECDQGHCFEGWFDDGDAYAHQAEEGLIICPICESVTVRKLPSAFSIGSSAAGPPPPADTGDAGDGDRDMEKAVAKLGRQLADYLDKSFDDVGCNFAREALKIHYGASEPRNIRGVSSPEEEKMLEKEGVPFMKLPAPKESEGDC